MIWVVFSVMVELSGGTHMLHRVDVGQAVQAEDVALLPVLVDLGDSQSCSGLRRRVFTRPLLQASLLHRCPVHTAQRQQQRQHHAVLHGEDPGRLCASVFEERLTHHTKAGNRDAQRGTG